ncbi:ER to golgi transport protein/RAD50-interacting protein 1 [Pseudoloma neurophilia]|uniref:ER to golgi transport protein/RAD50-interacting protein 1 n=1 Tax=Pseudoloma neurophilia TaxID=146866 RepID=A0A0R0LY44_9MICR|nr:ER to golgi transport protein/RAD50-interacting protein 1 [Pseudoloma neurophilia]
MYNLLEEREQLKNKLKILRKRLGTAELDEVDPQNAQFIFEKQDLLQKLKDQEKSAAHLINELTDKVNEYKNHEKTQMRENIINSIQGHITEINSWTVQSEKEYLKLLKIERKNAKLPIFADKIRKLARKIRQQVITNLEKDLEEIITIDGNIVDLLEVILKVKKAESVFTEQIFTNLIHSKIYDEFSFHFFTQKETNRLDKPEWYFQFLTQQLEKASFLCKCYDRVSLESEHTKLGTMKISPSKQDSQSIHGLILKIYSILEIKINELKKTESKQKRNLLFHFTEQYLLFRENLIRSYNMSLQIIDLPETILKIQKDHIMENFNQIHVQTFSEWFKNYKKIYKENFLLAFSYVSLQSDLFNNLILFITEAIVDYLETFLNKMTFYNQEEKNTLCLVISGVDKLKNYLRSEELSFILQIEQKTECAPEILSGISVDTRPFVKFIEKHLGFVRKIISHDIIQILSNISYFDTITEEKMIKYTGMLTKKTAHYFESLSEQRFFVESTIIREIDEFIVRNIVLKRKFDSGTLFLYHDFIKKVMQLDERKSEWQCLLAYQHLKNIFDGVRDGDEFFSQIFSLYQR